MTHTVLHIGDIHLCSGHPRNEDRLRALDQILTYASTVEHLAATVIPGDLFHQKSTVTDRNELADRLVALATMAPIAIAQGNHDEPEGLDIFARLDTRWPIQIATTTTGPRMIEMPTPTGIRIACFALPWPYKGGMVAAGVDHASLDQEGRHLLDPVFMWAAAELEAAAARGCLPLMIAHATIGGATASSGQPQIGTGSIEIDPGLLARLGPIYKGFSHIHKHQALHGAVYAGSICRMDFGENEEKGFIEVEYQRDGDRWEHRWGFRPLQVSAQLLVEGNLTRDRFVWHIVGHECAELPCDDCAARVPGADVRVKYSFVKAEIGALDVAKIHAAFAEARSLKLEPVAALEHQVRAPEIVAAATLEAKVEAYADRHGIAWTPGLVDKLAALQSKDGAALLTELNTSLAAAGTTPAPVAEQAVA